MAGHAGPLTTYTWKTLWRSNPALDLDLSFTVAGDVSIDAASDLMPPSTPPTPYPFPSELVAFNLEVGFLRITLSDFTSANFNGPFTTFPMWSLSIHADGSGHGADLALFFINSIDSEEISDPLHVAPGEAPGVIAYTSDGYTGCDKTDFPCIFSGVLEAAEPASLTLLGVGLLGAGVVRRRRRSTAL